MGPGLTGNLVRARATAIFFELDKDGSGGLTPNELQAWFARYTCVNVHVRACVHACNMVCDAAMYRALGWCVRAAHLPIMKPIWF